MQIVTVTFITLVLLSPILFWMYILQSFPHLGVSRRQFFIGIWAWAITTLPLIYNDFWIVSSLLENIFFSFSYISQSIFWLEIFIRIFLFFACIFLLGSLLIFFKKHAISKSYLRSCLWFSVLIASSSVIIYLAYFILWSSVQGESITSWDYVFQWFALIFWYYVIISLLEEGLKYFWNNQVLLWSSRNMHKVIWFACASWLGFAFFENLLYTYSYYQGSNWFEGLFQLVFFRSIFTVSLHILCAILLAAGLYVFSNSFGVSRKIYFALFWLGGGAIFSHAFYDIALTYDYIGVIFLYTFALYVAVVYITNEWWAENSSHL